MLSLAASYIFDVYRCFRFALSVQFIAILDSREACSPRCSRVTLGRSGSITAPAVNFGRRRLRLGDVLAAEMSSGRCGFCSYIFAACHAEFIGYESGRSGSWPAARLPPGHVLCRRYTRRPPTTSDRPPRAMGSHLALMAPWRLPVYNLAQVRRPVHTGSDR